MTPSAAIVGRRLDQDPIGRSAVRPPIFTEPLEDASDDAARLVESLRAAFRDPSLCGEDARRLGALALEAAWAIRRRRDADVMRRMRLELEAQAALSRRLVKSHLRNRDTVLGALSAGRAGVFECDLKDERLTWTAGVYDLFDLPAGSRLYRQDTIGCYTPSSRLALETVRAAAVRDGHGFRFDAEIETAKGVRRWIRLNCVVHRDDGVAVRLSGLKQDVTEDKAIETAARRLAEVDALTGLANRRLFEEKLAELAERPRAVLLLVDLDGFKQINDSFGHLVGDDCLKEAAARLKRSCRDAALVARIGGDEFAVLFEDGLDASDIDSRARQAVEALRVVVEQGGFRLELGGSAGLARADHSGASDWISRADLALYAAKADGRGKVRSFLQSMVRVRADVDEASAPSRRSA